MKQFIPEVQPAKTIYIGIGKTFFGLYLICRYANNFPNKNIEWQDKSTRVTLLANGGIIFFTTRTRIYSPVLANGDVIEPFIGDIPSSPQFTIVDAITPPKPFRQYVLVTSPKRQRYKKLNKAPNTKMFGMPVWNEDELYTLWQSQYSALNEQEWKERFYKWGGVPRSIFIKTDDAYQSSLKYNIDQLDIDACLRSIGLTGYETSSISGTVLHLTVTEDYEDFKVIFASLYVEALVFQQYEKSMWQKFTHFIQASEDDKFFSSARGFIFEALAHRLLTRGGQFHVCPPFL